MEGHDKKVPALRTGRVPPTFKFIPAPLVGGALFMPHVLTAVRGLWICAHV